MPLPHSPYAPTNPFDPKPVGLCDRCSFLYPLDRLTKQQVWTGFRLTTLDVMCCPRCLDIPQENGRRTIIIGPDPKPLGKDVRPTRYVSQAGPTPQNFVLDDPDTGNLDGGGSL